MVTFIVIRCCREPGQTSQGQSTVQGSQESTLTQQLDVLVDQASIVATRRIALVCCVVVYLVVLALSCCLAYAVIVDVRVECLRQSLKFVIAPSGLAGCQFPPPQFAGER